MKGNGRLIETKGDFAEKQRQARKLTVGEMERAFNQLTSDLERFAHAMMERLDGLERHTGYDHQAVQHAKAAADALSAAAQKTGSDLE